MTTIRQAVSKSDFAAALVLFRRYAASLPFSLSYQGFEAELAGLPAPYAPPDGGLLLARRAADYLGRSD